MMIIVFGLCLLTADCKKFEYLENYYGIWSFRYSWTLEKMVVPIIGDTVYYTGEIKKGEGDGYLRILYTEVNSINVKVEADGQILNQCEPPPIEHFSESCSGYFSGDSLYFKHSSYHPPNQVSIFNSILLGKKLK